MRMLLCALLCIGATLDDIDYINAIRAPRTMAGIRGSSIADEDSDDQHGHVVLARTAQVINLSAPFLAPLYAVLPPELPSATYPSTVIRSGRAPPVQA